MTFFNDPTPSEQAQTEQVAWLDKHQDVLVQETDRADRVPSSSFSLNPVPLIQRAWSNPRPLLGLAYGVLFCVAVHRYQQALAHPFPLESWMNPKFYPHGQIDNARNQLWFTGLVGTGLAVAELKNLGALVFDKLRGRHVNPIARQTSALPDLSTPSLDEGLYAELMREAVTLATPDPKRVHGVR